MSWGSSVLALCSVAYPSNSPEVRHSVYSSTECFQLARTPGCAGDWAAGGSQAEVDCWVILDVNQLLKGLEFMRWRNSILWPCRSRGSALLRLPADSSCEGRQDMFSFQYTTKGNFHTLLFNFCTWRWYAFFRGLPHRASGSDTSLSESSDEKLWVSGVSIYFPHARFHFQSDISTLRADKILSGFSESLFAEPEDLGLLWDTLPWSIPNHAGWRQRHKPQLQAGTCTELGLFGFYFEWSLITSNVLHDVLPKSQRRTPSKTPASFGRRCDTL